MSEIILTVDGVNPVDLYGSDNVRLKLLKQAFPDINIVSRGNSLRLTGDKKLTQKAKSKVEMMVRLLRQNNELSTHTVQELLNTANDTHEIWQMESKQSIILHGRNGKAIRAKTKNQKRMVEAIEQNDIVFAIGPAGTGKTYTAVALAVKALKNRMVKKIILTRPAVEAGESLGFLPGDLKEKIDPYLRPLYDALDDMIAPDKLKQFMGDRTIEVAPLAFMRGRTLNNAFIILDEAQNTTSTQLKMFLTRLGPSAKCMITGDLSQVDLPARQKSGLRTATRILSKLEGISTIYLDKDDVIRHRLVKQIIGAYEKINSRTEEE